MKEGEREGERERVREGERDKNVIHYLLLQDHLELVRPDSCCATSTTHLRTRSRDLSLRRRNRLPLMGERWCWISGTLQVKC